jgi:CMD domain protein
MDAIDTLIGIEPGSFLDTLRRQKPITRDNAQASFDALFAPADLQEMTASERAAVAYFVAGLHRQGLDFYRNGNSPAVIAALDGEIAHATGSGPYGSFPAGPLTPEDQPGPTYTVADRNALGPRLTAALEHVHMLVFHPRDAAPSHMRVLEAAGWSATGIVTLSQLVSFLSFQLRVTAGLRALDRNRA